MKKILILIVTLVILLEKTVYSVHAGVTDFTTVTVNGEVQQLTVRNYTQASHATVTQLVQASERSILSQPPNAEHFGNNDLLILTRHYFLWIKNTQTEIRTVNNTGNGGGMMKGFWTINGNNTTPNFLYTHLQFGVVNELGRSPYLESDGCVLALQIGSGHDSGNAYFANFSSDGTQSSSLFPQKSVPTDIGLADIYYFSGTMRNAQNNTVLINGNTVSYLISYHINNDSPLVEVNPVLTANGNINEVAVIWNSCEVNDFRTPLKYIGLRSNAFLRFTWGTPDERSVYKTDNAAIQVLRMKEPSDVIINNSTLKDGDFRDVIGVSNIYKTDPNKTTMSSFNYQPVSVGQVLNNAGTYQWHMDDLLGDTRFSSLIMADTDKLDHRSLMFRVLTDTNGRDKEGTNNVQFMSATFTDYFANPAYSLSRPSFPNAYNSLDQDASVISLEAYLYHKNGYIQDVAAGKRTPFIDDDSNQITDNGNKNFSSGRIWNFIYQFGHPLTPLNPPTPTNSPAPGISGDLNNDSRVDIFDYNLLLSDFGKTGASGFTKADINADGKVDIFDYNLMVRNYGR